MLANNLSSSSGAHMMEETPPINCHETSTHISWHETFYPLFSLLTFNKKKKNIAYGFNLNYSLIFFGASVFKSYSKIR